MLSVRTVAYMTKLARKSKENRSSQSMPFVRTLGRGPSQSSLVTATSLLASIPKKASTWSTPVIIIKYREVGSIWSFVFLWLRHIYSYDLIFWQDGPCISSKQFTCIKTYNLYVYFHNGRLVPSSIAQPCVSLGGQECGGFFWVEYFCHINKYNNFWPLTKALVGFFCFVFLFCFAFLYRSTEGPESWLALSSQRGQPDHGNWNPFVSSSARTETILSPSRCQPYMALAMILRFTWLYSQIKYLGRKMCWILLAPSLVKAQCFPLLCDSSPMSWVSAFSTPWNAAHYSNWLDKTLPGPLRVFTKFILKKKQQGEESPVWS